MSANAHGNYKFGVRRETVSHCPMTQDHDFPPSQRMGIPVCGQSEERKKKQDEEKSPQQSNGSQFVTGDPLTVLTHGVQCWETRELRCSHVVFSIVFCTWVGHSLSVPY